MLNIMIENQLKIVCLSQNSQLTKQPNNQLTKSSKQPINQINQLTILPINQLTNHQLTNQPITN